MKDKVKDKVYVVISKFDTHYPFPFLAIFSSYEEADTYKESILEEHDSSYRNMGFVWIDEVELGKSRV